MAIGENSYFGNGSDNNATRRTTPEYSYYPRLSFTTEDQSVNLKFEMRSGLLQFKLYKKEPSGYYPSDPTEIIYVSPAKAAMLDEQIQKFKDYVENSKKIDENVAFGINGGMNEKVSFIAFHSNQDKDIFITIGKFDGNGTITESLDYKIQKNFNYALDWKNLRSMDLEKSYYDNLELDTIHNLVKDFARSMNGASAYAVHDLGRYDLARVLNKMDPVYDRLGIERQNGTYSNRQRGTNNFLNGVGSTGNTSEFSSSTHSEHTSLDDLMGA